MEAVTLSVKTCGFATSPKRGGKGGCKQCIGGGGGSENRNRFCRVSRDRVPWDARRGQGTRPTDSIQTDSTKPKSAMRRGWDEVEWFCHGRSAVRGFCRVSRDRVPWDARRGQGTRPTHFIQTDSIIRNRRCGATRRSRPTGFAQTKSTRCRAGRLCPPLVKTEIDSVAFHATASLGTRGGAKAPALRILFKPTAQNRNRQGGATRRSRPTGASAVQRTDLSVPLFFLLWNRILCGILNYTLYFSR